MLRLSAERLQLKILPVNLPIEPWPVGIVTLKAGCLSESLSSSLIALVLLQKKISGECGIKLLWYCAWRPELFPLRHESLRFALRASASGPSRNPTPSAVAAAL